MRSQIQTGDRDWLRPSMLQQLLIPPLVYHSLSFLFSFQLQLYEGTWSRLSLLGLKGGRRVSLTTTPPSVRRLSRKCGSLDVSQSYGPPRSVTGTALHSLLDLSSIPRLTYSSFRPNASQSSRQSVSQSQCYSLRQNTSINSHSTYCIPEYHVLLFACGCCGDRAFERHTLHVAHCVICFIPLQR
jgi:hypothetical protein